MTTEPPPTLENDHSEAPASPTPYAPVVLPHDARTQIETALLGRTNTNGAAAVMSLLMTWPCVPSNDQSGPPTITHGTRVLVHPGPNRENTRDPNLDRNHGVGRITWISQNIDPTKSQWGVSMDEPYYGTSVVEYADFEVLPDPPRQHFFATLTDRAIEAPSIALHTPKSCPECSAQPWRPHRDDCPTLIDHGFDPVTE